MMMQTVQQHKNVERWKTTNGTYALKRVKSLAHWQAIEQAHRLRIPLAIPIYEMKKRDGQWYYIMPWLKEKADPGSSFFHDLARWHKHSLKEIQTIETEIERYYEERKLSLEDAKKTLTHYIETCEKQWYMSPFQLQCCTHFLDIMRAITFSEHTLNEWRERMREKKTVRICYIHGRPSFQHYVERDDGTSYFISFEQARWAPPFHDLLLFFRQYLQTYPMTCDDAVQWLSQYEQTLALEEDERLLFFHLLVDPHRFVRLIHRYEQQRHHRQMTAVWQRAYWQMKNIEYVIGKWEEEKQTNQIQS
ncbi:aminoglycoside phosphotransferase [Anoxybacillus ayderensis]|uniref:aminoglycoside phosphotransferase n=2 Tax=Anoxybacillus ayderensis TaxID=265546 RepID=UPI000A267E53|nr:aminoglycoside phosphotransferase [Anoxybacillus ayderensis]MBA2878524.1 spore coat protein YsxE [Anoxybacillus ayderensis]OSX54465.1 aminoglycoside phosphotransferase [Anoxybacillus ayderensis]